MVETNPYMPKKTTSGRYELHTEQFHHQWEHLMRALKKSKTNKLTDEEQAAARKEADDNVRYLEEAIAVEHNNVLVPAVETILGTEGVHPFDKRLIKKHWTHMEEYHDLDDPRRKYLEMDILTAAMLEELNGGNDTYIDKHYLLNGEAEAKTMLKNYTKELHTLADLLEKRVTILAKFDDRQFRLLCREFFDQVKDHIYISIEEARVMAIELDDDTLSQAADDYEEAIQDLHMCLDEDGFQEAGRIADGILSDYDEDTIDKLFKGKEEQEDTVLELNVDMYMLKAFVNKYAGFLQY